MQRDLQLLKVSLQEITITIMNTNEYIVGGTVL